MVKKISNQKIEYDADIDALYVHRYPEQKEVYGSLHLGNFVIDVDSEGIIIGLEIDNASEILGMKPEKLETINDAAITVMRQNGIVLIRYQMTFQGASEKHTGSVVIPQQKLPAKVLSQ